MEHADPPQDQTAARDGDSTTVVRAIESFRAGDARDDSFRVIFETYYPTVRAFFLRRATSAETGLDLAQETFLRVYRGLDGFRGDAPFGAWLFRIAWNVLRRGGRGGAARRAEIPWQDAGHEAERTLTRDADPSDRGSALDAVLDAEQRAVLRRAIDDLPTQRRRCMTLWAYHELSYEQIATVMGLSIGTVKAHLSQARQQLEAQMARQLEERS